MSAQLNCPRLQDRASATPWYSGVAGTGSSSHPGDCEGGRKRETTWPMSAQLNCPRLQDRASATPWYSGVARTSSSSHPGYCEMGKKTPEKRNMGRSASMTRSKSCQLRRYVHAAIPALANASETRNATGRQRIAHGDWVSPSAHMHTRKLTE